MLSWCTVHRRHTTTHDHVVRSPHPRPRQGEGDPIVRHTTDTARKRNDRRSADARRGVGVPGDDRHDRPAGVGGGTIMVVDRRVGVGRGTSRGVRRMAGRGRGAIRGRWWGAMGGGVCCEVR